MPTNISLINLSSAGDLAVTTTVEPALSSDDWAATATNAPESRDPLQVLWFNRNEGITRGDTWTFTTELEVDGVTVQLQERVTGTAINSTMEQCMTAGPDTTHFIDENGTQRLTFQGASGASYSLEWDVGGLPNADITYTLTQTLPPLKRVTPVLGQIDTIVFLMLENRSLDNVLGWVRTTSSTTYFPDGSTAAFDGVPPGGFSNTHGDDPPYSMKDGTADANEPCRVPAYDPNEAMDHVQYQLYADSDGNLPEGDFWKSPPGMTGFGWDYYEAYESDPGEVMGAYNADQLPVLYGLAESFAVSDLWFSSVPTQTFPNRAYSICGTSLGAEDNSQINGSTFANTPTIFNVLGQVGKTWGLYWQSENPISSGVPIWGYSPFSSYYFPMMNEAPCGGVQDWDVFMSQLAAGTLPSFCYLEPFWGGGKGVPWDPDDWIGIQGNDYHPNAWVGPAEASLNDLYEALKASPQWPNMLFIITFDEHGGTADHCPPTVAVAPDSHVGPSGFDFTRLGVRVPTILVSPYVDGPVVFRAPDGSQQDFDHASFLATFCKWAGVDPASAGLGERVAAAPTFEDVLSQTPRTGDLPTFDVPDDYAGQGGGVGAIMGVQPPSLRKGVHVSDVRELMDRKGDVTSFKDDLAALLSRGASD